MESPVLILILAAVLALLLLLYYLFVHGKKAKGSTGGMELGVYANLQLLSDKGAFARIYRAFNREMGRECVLKVLRSTHLGDGDAVRRFNQEAEVLEHIHRAYPHAPVTRLYGTGIITAMTVDLPFIEMEYIPPSFDLGEYVHTHGRLEPLVAETVVEQVLRALEAAHGSGTVHRDLKPGNILLANEDPRQVVICDFGVAKQVDSRSMTAGGYGTAAYMSPEQCRVGGRISGKSDIYSLGVVWYEMMSGTKLYDDPNPLVVMRQHEEARFEDKLIRSVPEKYHGILRKMLSIEPSARPDIGEIRATLSKEAVSISGFLQASGPVSSAATARTRRPAPSRSPALVSLLVVMLLTLTVAAVFKALKQHPDPGSVLGPIPPRRDAIPEVANSAGQFAYPPGVNTWRLTIATSPPGCDVYYLEDESGAYSRQRNSIIGVTPYNGYFPDGTFTFQIKKRGFAPTTVKVENTQNSLHTYFFTLERAKAAFGIRVPVGDLRVLLDGREIDRTNFAAIKTSIGEHKLLVSGETVIDTTIEFTLSDENDSQMFDVTGIRRKRGWIHVTCSGHPDAKVTIDGRTQPVGTGVTQELIIDKYVVEVSLAGFENYTTSKEITYNDTIDVSIPLQPSPARLIVTTNMEGTITIAGQKKAIGPNRSESISLAPGNYQAEFEVPGYDRKTVSLELLSGETKPLKHDFRLPGKLTVHGGWGDVFVDGVRLAGQAPGSWPLKPGSHIVRIERNGKPVREETVTIDSNSESKIQVE